MEDSQPFSPSLMEKLRLATGRHGPVLGNPKLDGGEPAQLSGICQFDGEDAVSPQEETLV